MEYGISASKQWLNSGQIRQIWKWIQDLRGVCKRRDDWMGGKEAKMGAWVARQAVHMKPGWQGWKPGWQGRQFIWSLGGKDGSQRGKAGSWAQRRQMGVHGSKAAPQLHFPSLGSRVLRYLRSLWSICALLCCCEDVFIFSLKQNTSFRQNLLNTVKY